jgi:Domain of unknown function (DUF4440)
MTKQTFIAVTLISLVWETLAFGQQSQDETQLLKLEHEWSQAFFKHDTKILNRLLLGSFVSTYQGTVRNKGQYLELASQPVMDQIEKIEEIHPVIVGDTGVVIGRESFTAKIEGKRISGDFCFTDVWVRQKRQWRVLATHESKIDTK